MQSMFFSKNVGLLLIFLIAGMTVAFAQKGTLKGAVTDSKSGEPLIGVNVVATEGTGASTDFDGNYSLSLDAGTHTITFRYIGYDDLVREISLTSGQTLELSVKLVEEVQEMDLVVVSASKYEKKASEETVTIDVLQSEIIENSNAVDMEEAVSKVPGVTIADGQANIRGGSGWSYGAGSRVLVLVDDLPLLTADAGDAKWSFIPTENTLQVEVLKGAASALYGSSALNGIINIRTAWPSNEPYSKLILFQGIYDNPSRSPEMQWWGKNQPLFGGGSFVHRRKIQNFDLVLGGNFYLNRSYLDGGSYQFYRTNMKTRYRPKNVSGLSFGVNLNYYQSTGSTFFLWDGIDSLGYRPLPGSISNYKTLRLTVDPFVTYFDAKENQYSFRARYFNAKNTNDTEQGSLPQLYYAEGLWQRFFTELEMNVVAGVSGYYSTVTSPNGIDTSSLIGEHDGSNASLYFQVDKKFFDRLSLAFGARYEYFRIDTFSDHSSIRFGNKLLKAPVLRFGANFQIAEVTYLRASIGQGYRFPTMAEKFINTSVGGAIGIYPNTKLEPETGWSAELGFKQGVKIGNWLGYLDVAGFINQYSNMMEFTFNQMGADVSLDNFLGLGFSSQNVGETRIVGMEFTAIGSGNIGPVSTNLLFGYTYIMPKSLNWDDELVLFNEEGEQIDLTFGSKDGDLTYSSYSSSDKNILKYRNQHTLKLDVESNYKKWRVGLSIQYTSFIENIDYVFLSDLLTGFESQLGTEAFTGLINFREQQENRNRPGDLTKGDLVIDGRIAYEITDNAKISLVVKNILNEEYTRRPAYFGPPRNFTLQFAYVFD